MLGQGKLRGRISFHGVTLLTGPVQRAADEVGPVIIGMAIHAFFKLQTGVGLSGLVAGLALQCGMFPQKRIAGLPAVVKSGPVGQLPILCAVAALATRAKPLAVRVLMTVGTELMRDFGEVQKFLVVCFWSRVDHRRMALGARGRHMPAGEGEFCFAVVESRGRAPARHRVAGKTGRGKLATVFVQMAARAVPLQTQEGFLEVFFLVQKLFLIADESGLVAGLAF